MQSIQDERALRLQVRVCVREMVWRCGGLWRRERVYALHVRWRCYM
jgi:hypothetical protein